MLTNHSSLVQFGCIILRELAMVVPTFYYQWMKTFFDSIFMSVRDPKPSVREQALYAIRSGMQCVFLCVFVFFLCVYVCVFLIFMCVFDIYVCVCYLYVCLSFFFVCVSVFFCVCLCFLFVCLCCFAIFFLSQRASLVVAAQRETRGGPKEAHHNAPIWYRKCYDEAVVLLDDHLPPPSFKVNERWNLDLQKRPLHFRRNTFSTFLIQEATGKDAKPTPRDDRIHGYLLIINELFRLANLRAEKMRIELEELLQPRDNFEQRPFKGELPIGSVS